jgi:glycosyltransferase involved in cell wall biosynthesis
LPVLVPRINGAEDFIIPGINGEFINHDPAGIAAVLGRLARDPLAREAMGRASRKIVEESYTWDHVAAETEAAYRALIDARAVEFGDPECCAQ